MKLKTLVPCAALSLLSVACGDDGPKVTRTIDSTGNWIVYADPFADGRPNPATGVTGKAQALEFEDGTTEVTLTVANATASRHFGSHVHKLACDDNKAGGHYQNNPFTTTASDPVFANPANEVWLDFETDASGGATSTAQVSWKVRTGEAKAVVLHSDHTSEGGIAGAKLACITIPF